MKASTLSYALETLHDGATVFIGGSGRALPLRSTEISVRIASGLAIVNTIRTFENCESVPIEVVLTMPVGFDAVVTGLSAEIDGRTLSAVAKSRSNARSEYEDTLNNGKLAVLHEEALRGIHVVSIAQLAPSKVVAVNIETVVPLAMIEDCPFLRIPTTVGQLYGTSPLQPADDLITSDAVPYFASLSVECASGTAQLSGCQIISAASPVDVPLDAAIEIQVVNGSFGVLQGHSIDGQKVSIELQPLEQSDDALEIAILVDRSGSTASQVGKMGSTVWTAMKAGVEKALHGMTDLDSAAIWEFNEAYRHIGTAHGASACHLISSLSGPNGGTELGVAVMAAVNAGSCDILVLTDGETWANTVGELAGKGVRISAVLVGSNSLDANIGHLCAMTGGQVFYAPGEDVASAVTSALTALRIKGTGTTGEILSGKPQSVSTIRGGIRISAKWESTSSQRPIDALSRYAAALALPLLDDEEAQALAEANGLCTHLTSLVLVDDAGEQTDMLPEMRKVPLPRASSHLRMPKTSHNASVVMSVARPEKGEIFSLQRRAMPLSERMITRQSNTLIDATLLAAAIDWDASANSFLKNEMGMLPAWGLVLARKIASAQTIEAVALAARVSKNMAALAIIASLAPENNKAASRFFKYVLGLVSKELLDATKAEIYDFDRDQYGEYK